MKRFYLAQLVIAFTVFASPISASDFAYSDEIVFASEESNNDCSQKISSREKNKQDISKLLDNFAVHYKDKFGSEAEARKRGAFLLTGVIVYQTTRIVGHAGIWAGAAGALALGFASGGLPGAGVAYLNVVAVIPAASAAVESGSLALGTAASFIPGLP